MASSRSVFEKEVVTEPKTATIGIMEMVEQHSRLKFAKNETNSDDKSCLPKKFLSKNNSKNKNNSQTDIVSENGTVYPPAPAIGRLFALVCGGIGVAHSFPIQRVTVDLETKDLIQVIHDLNPNDENNVNVVANAKPDQQQNCMDVIEFAENNRTQKNSVVSDNQPQEITPKITAVPVKKNKFRAFSFFDRANKTENEAENNNNTPENIIPNNRANSIHIIPMPVESDNNNSNNLQMTNSILIKEEVKQLRLTQNIPKKNTSFAENIDICHLDVNGIQNPMIGGIIEESLSGRGTPMNVSQNQRKMNWKPAAFFADRQKSSENLVSKK